MSSALTLSDQEALASIDQWRRTRDERCRDPNGWLALAGLHWLVEGANTLGRDDSNSIVFAPSSTPPKLGVLHLTNVRDLDINQAQISLARDLSST